MKPLKKVGKDDPKGWEQPHDTSFPIVPEPEDENELPVPYYDSDEAGEQSDDDDECSEYTDYTSDSSVASSSRRMPVYKTRPLETRIFKTVVQEENDFLQE